jgi:membrane associated rhomboid family serine protease
LEVDVRLIVVASIQIGSLFVFVFSNWKNGINGRTGAIAGAIIFLLAGSAFDAATYAPTNLYNSPIIIFLSAAGSLIGGTVVGCVTGWWLGRKANKKEDDKSNQ